MSSIIELNAIIVPIPRLCSTPITRKPKASAICEIIHQLISCGTYFRTFTVVRIKRQNVWTFGIACKINSNMNGAAGQARHPPHQKYPTTSTVTTSNKTASIR